MSLHGFVPVAIDVILNGVYNDVYIFLLLSGKPKVVDNHEGFVGKHKFNACTLVSADSSESPDRLM